MKYNILLLIFTICLTSSVLLAFIPIAEICGTETSGCSIVSNTKYKYTLGMNNSYLGIIAFTLLITLVLLQKRRPTKKKSVLITLGIIIGSIGALYFIYLQAIVIGAYCKYCMIVDVGILLALLVIIIERILQLKGKI